MLEESRRLTIVIGASRGIGRHLAQRAAARGDAVLACARDSAALATLAVAPGEGAGSIETLAGDFLGPDSDFRDVADAIAAHPGPVTLIVSAATIGPVGALGDVNLAAWAEALDRNVCGPARALAATLPHLSPDDLAVVFSGGGVGGPSPQPNVSSYTTSKAALVQFVEVTARENPDGPTLVAIAPGSFPTTFVDPVFAVDPAVAGDRLLDDVRRTKRGPLDASHLETLLDYLETSDAHWLSGRCLSAKRDTPDVLTSTPETARRSPDLFRLRRVDGVGVVVQDW